MLGLGLSGGLRGKVRLHGGNLRLVIVIAVHCLIIVLEDRLARMRVMRGAWGIASLTWKAVSLCGELALGRFLVSLSHAFVPLALGEVDHPVAALAWLSDRPLDLEEALSQGQIMSDRVLSHLVSSAGTAI